MKSFKNHLSLVIALLSILFSIQIFIVVDRSIDAYKVNLANNYSVIVVSQKKLDNKTIVNFVRSFFYGINTKNNNMVF